MFDNSLSVKSAFAFIFSFLYLCNSYGRSIMKLISRIGTVTVTQRNTYFGIKLQAYFKWQRIYEEISLFPYHSLLTREIIFVIAVVSGTEKVAFILKNHFSN